MTSKDRNSSKSELLYLIYQHLKEHGYQKAAGVLRKQLTQKETSTPQTSLDDIYINWLNSVEGSKKRTEHIVSPMKKHILSDPASNKEIAGRKTTVLSASQTSKTITHVKPTLTKAAVKESETSGSESTDASETEEKTSQPQNSVATLKANSAPENSKAQTAVTSEPAKSSGSENGSETEDEIQPSQVPFFTPKQTPNKPLGLPMVTSKGDDSDSTSEDSDSEEDTVALKATQTTPATPGTSIKHKGAEVMTVKKDSMTKLQGELTQTQAKTSLPSLLKILAVSKQSRVTTGSSSKQEESLIKHITTKGSPVKPTQATPIKTTVSPMKAATTPKTSTPGKNARSSESETTQDSDSEEDTPAKPILAKVSPTISNHSIPIKATASAKVRAIGKRAESSDTPVKGPAKSVLTKGLKSTQPTPVKTASTPKKQAFGKKAKCSDSESTDDSESEEEAPTKTVLAKGTINKSSQSTPMKSTATTKTPATATSKTPAAGKKDKTSDSGSTDDSEIAKKTSKGKEVESKSSSSQANPKVTNPASTKKTILGANETMKATVGVKRKMSQEKFETNSEKLKKKKKELHKAIGSLPSKPLAAPAWGDSDSDSSLDVEKWKKLALQLTDVDIVKIDAMTPVVPCSPTQAKAKKKGKAMGNRETKAVEKKGNISESRNEKSLPVTGHLSGSKGEDSMAATAAKTTPVKRPLSTIIPEQGGPQTPKKRKTSGKESTKKSGKLTTLPEPNKEKDVKGKKKNKEKAKLKEDKADVHQISPANTNLPLGKKPKKSEVIQE
ncbi:treacle protein-like [Arapaima gigas]